MSVDPMARIRAAVEEIERRSRRDADRDARRGTELAEAARRGDLGPDWRRVQQRVDRGETTLADVFGGRDASPEAAALVRRSREQLATYAGVARESADVTEAADDLAAARARLDAWGPGARAAEQAPLPQPRDGRDPA